MMLTNEHLTPWDLADETYERPAPMCFGPGHLLDDWDQRIEDCPECKGKIRNHGTARRVAR